MLNVNNLIGFGAGGAGPAAPNVVYLGTRENLTESNFTISGASLGQEASNRIIVVAFATLNTNHPTAITIGGVAATKVASTDVATGVVASVWYASVPNGSTGDIVVTKPSESYAMSWFAGYTNTPAPVDTGTADVPVDNATITIDAVANGFMVWAQSDRSNSATHTANWTGAGETIFTDELTVSSTRSGSAGTVKHTASATANFTLTAGPDSNRVAIASWAP